MSLPHVIELIDLQALYAMHVIEADGEKLLHCAFKLAERDYAEVVSELKLPTFVGFHTFHVEPPMQTEDATGAALVRSAYIMDVPAVAEDAPTVMSEPSSEAVVDAPAPKNGKKNGGGSEEEQQA